MTVSILINNKYEYHGERLIQIVEGKLLIDGVEQPLAVPATSGTMVSAGEGSRLTNINHVLSVVPMDNEGDLCNSQE